jgi:inner membrane protein
MDNLCHTLLGAALAKSLPNVRRADYITLVVAANIPDLDIVVELFGGRPAYLIHHRGITHSIVGVVAQSLLLATVVSLVLRCRKRTKLNPDASPSWLRLLWVALLGAASHLGLDALNTYGVRPFLPFLDRWYYGDIAYIVDPWLWLIFGGCAAWAGRRRKLGHWTWIVLATIASFFLVTSSRATIDGLSLWFTALAVLALGRCKGIGFTHPGRTVAIGMSLALSYLFTLWCLGLSAERAGLEAIQTALPENHTLEDHSRAPSAAIPWKWRVFGVTSQEVHVHHVDLLGENPSQPLIILRRNLQDPRLSGVEELREYHAWQVFARHPCVVFLDQDLLLFDARYSFGSGRWCDLRLPLSASDR